MLDRPIRFLQAGDSTTITDSMSPLYNTLQTTARHFTNRIFPTVFCKPSTTITMYSSLCKHDCLAMPSRLLSPTTYVITHGTTDLIMVTNWLRVSSSGTRNLVLSRIGKSFSFWYRSTITWENRRANKHPKTRQTCTTHKLTCRGQLTGTLLGNFALILATSSFLLAK